MKQPIITISREFGSGGREIGKMIADHFSIPYYDNALITLAAKKSGFVEELFEQIQHCVATSGYKNFPVVGVLTGGGSQMPA